MARILIVAGDGTASDHLDYAYFRMLEEGFEVHIAGPEKRKLKTAIHMGSVGDPIYTIERQGYVTQAHIGFNDVNPADYDGLFLPGGRGPEYLRLIPRCVEIVRHFVQADKPIAAMCHGPMLLLAAGVTGRRLSCTDDTGIDVELHGNTYIETGFPFNPKQPDHVVDGNIVTVRRRPNHHVWVREFLNLLEKRGIKRPLKPVLKPAKALIIAGDFTSGGQLSYAQDRLREAGLEVTIAGHEKKRLDTVVDMREEGWDMRDGEPAAYNFETLGFWIPAHVKVDEIDPSQYDVLVLPGWRGAEYLRNIPACRKIVQHFLESGKPIGAICQATRMLLAAGVKGRKLAGHHVIRCEIELDNTYVDAKDEAVIDGNIVTVSGRPYYHQWMRAVLSLLQKAQA